QVYWTKAKMIKHADTYSPAFHADKYDDYVNGKIPKNELYKYSSFWYKNFDEMAFKTLIRHLISQWGVMSIEMQDAFIRDNAVIKENGEPEYVEYDEEAFAEPAQATETSSSEEVQPTPEEQGEFDFFADTDDTEG